jgi:hypothetical protein
MEQCVVDNVPERVVPPHRQAIEETRQRQLAALQSLRRLLVNTKPVRVQLVNG